MGIFRAIHGLFLYQLSGTKLLLVYLLPEASEIQIQGVSYAIRRSFFTYARNFFLQTRLLANAYRAHSLLSLRNLIVFGVCLVYSYAHLGNRRTLQTRTIDRSSIIAVLMNDHLVGDDGYQAEAAMEPPLTITNRDLDIELDPLDYFVIIKKLITQSLSANEIGILEAANVQGVDLEFPSDLGQHISAAPHGELEVEKTDLEEKLAALQLTIDEYEERSVKVRACSLCVRMCRHFSITCLVCQPCLTGDLLISSYRRIMIGRLSLRRTNLRTLRTSRLRVSCWSGARQCVVSPITGLEVAPITIPFVCAFLPYIAPFFDA